MYQAAIDAANAHFRNYEAISDGRKVLNGRSDTQSLAICLRQYWRSMAQASLSSSFRQQTKRL